MTSQKSSSIRNVAVTFVVVCFIVSLFYFFIFTPASVTPSVTPPVLVQVESRSHFENQFGAQTKTPETTMTATTTVTSSVKAETSHNDGAPAIITTTTLSSSSSPSSPSSSLFHYHYKRDYFNIPDGITRVIIEVGTNIDPAYADMAFAHPQTFYIGVEPIKHVEAENHACRKFASRCIILNAAVFAPDPADALARSRYSAAKYREYLKQKQPRSATIYLGHESACSSLLSGGRKGSCAQTRSSKRVRILTLDEIIDRIPRDLPVQLISIDAQGADFYVLSGLRKHVNRVANIIFECQDIAISTSSEKVMIYHDKRAKNCGQITACVQQQFFWSFPRGCTVNHQNIAEYNCAVHNPLHPLVNMSLKHPGDTGRRVVLRHEVEWCPVAEWRGGSVK